MTNVFLYVKQGIMCAVTDETVKQSMKANKLRQSEVLARLIDSEDVPKIAYTDLNNDYTIISDDEGLYSGNSLYVITDNDGTTYNIPGTFIFAKLDKDINTLPLNDEDRAYLKANVQIRCCEMPEL